MKSNLTRCRPAHTLVQQATRFLPTLKAGGASLLLAAALFSGETAHAVETTWLPTGTSAWNSAGNWDNGLPVVSSTAVLNNSGTATLSSGQTGAYSDLQIGNAINGSGAINISGGLLSGTYAYLGYAAEASGSATVTSGTWSNSTRLYVGYSGTGSLLVNGGYVSNLSGVIGSQATGNGSVTVTSGTWSNSTTLTVGSYGTGSLLVNGGYVSSYVGVIGSQATGNGSVTVSSGTWSHSGSGSLTVGHAGTGSLLVNGGYVSNSAGIIGNDAGGNGSATVTSGTWSNSLNLTVGSSGTGSLLVNGGHVLSLSGTIGNSAGGNGSATVTSGTWSNTLHLTVGSSGTGSLLVNGGYVSNRSGVIGDRGGGNGSATVTSGTWSNSIDLTVGASGTGTLAVSGGLVRVSGTTFVGNFAGGNGEITLSGNDGNRGVLETSRIMKGEGTGVVNFDGGVVRASRNESEFISNFQPGSVTIKDGGAYIDTNSFDIGISTSLGGSGALVKQGAGNLTLSASNSYTGGTVVNTGTLTAAHEFALGTGSVTLNGGTLAKKIAQSATLAGALNLSTTLGGGVTHAALLGGTSSAATSLQASFSATSAASNDELRSSSVLSLTGVTVINGLTGQTDVFVLQLQVANVMTESFLGWLDTESGKWVNAVMGNIGGSANSLGDKAYNAATDFTLGNYGVDTANGTVWAVLNHNSDFAVISPVPEPGTWALLVFGAGAALAWRRRQFARR